MVIGITYDFLTSYIGLASVTIDKMTSIITFLDNIFKILNKNYYFFDFIIKNTCRFYNILI